MNEIPVNIAIQLLPLCEKEKALDYIDQAITIIKHSGIKYEVGPFETTLEGDYNKIMNIVTSIKEEALNSGANDIIINLKISASRVKLLSIDDKVNKYR
jgi:uncharacterized protein YqgV (UPF0045/DUF77 family)